MMGALHSFPLMPPPVRQDHSPSNAHLVPRYWSEVQALGPKESGALLGTTKQIIQRSQILIDYVDRNRTEARRAGVETIAIQLSSILDGGRLDGVKEALEESIRAGSVTNISVDGFSKLRRAEHLLSEADRSISEYVEVPASGIHMGNSCHGHHGCNGHQGCHMGTSGGMSTPLVILAIVGAGAILTVVILALIKK